MELTKLLNTLDQFPLVTDATDRINEILMAMYSDDLPLREEDAPLDLIPLNDVTLRQVYDLPVEDDHWCVVEVLCIRGRPLAVFAKHGYVDSQPGETFVLDRETARQIGWQLMAAIADRNLRAFDKRLDEATPPKTLEDLGGNEYVGFRQGGAFFGIKDVAGCGDLNRLTLAPYAAYARFDDALVRVKSIRTTGRRHRGEHKLFVQTERGEHELDDGRLIFGLTPAEGDVSQLEKEMSPEAAWMVCSQKSIRSGIPSAVVYVRDPFNWASRMVLISFRTQPDYDAFVERYPYDKVFLGSFADAEVPATAQVV
ncbi:hypothetical protein F6X40_24080 [Paraburkholderia sp. UCT31]|uniref:hypothetical protein n=1 Tax=Paraburkholderia sp. UCT31 TaxID=2615209 RepID=UPI0016558379|nr:hypothetical protein [Paraburkholderia sp. UCT31]MBC8739796.1 hypothetical protein [Paraburkholderia sp. UCT31]